MDGKILIGTRGTTYSFVNGTRTITLSGLTTAISDISRVFFIYNDTQKKFYYAPEATLSLVTVSGSNTLVLDNSLSTLVTGDILKILIWDIDPTINWTTGTENNTILNLPVAYETEIKYNSTNLASGTTYLPSTDGQIVVGKLGRWQIDTSGGVTITYEFTDEVESATATRWFDGTKTMYVEDALSTNATSLAKVGLNGFGSFIDEQLSVSCDNRNCRRWRIKMVTSDATNSIYLSYRELPLGG